MTVDAYVAISPQAATGLLRRGLRSLRRRVRLLLALRLAAVGIALIAGLAAPAVLLARLSGIWYPPLLPEVALLAALVTSLLLGLVWPLPDSALALSADRRLGLADRIASAILFARAGLPSAMQRAEVADALHHLQRTRPAEGYPVRAYRATKAAALCLAALFSFQLLPIPALFLSPRERDEKALLREQAAKLYPLAQRLEDAARENEDLEAERLAGRLKKLAQQLDRGQLQKTQALVQLAQLHTDLQRAENRLARAPRKTAAQTADDLTKAARDNTASKALQLAERAEHSGDRESADEFRRLAREARRADDLVQLQDIASRLSDRASQLGAPLNFPPELLAALAQAFADADFDLSEDALQQLAEASAEWSGQLTQEELDALADELEALAEMLQDTDLAEVADLLKKAAECLRAGDCEGAAKYLAQCQGKLASCELGAACSSCKGGLAGILARLRGRALASPLRATGASAGTCAGGITDQPFIPLNAEAAKLYAPRTTETSGPLQRVRARVGPQGRMMAITEKGAPVKVTESRVPYYEVIADYSKAAEEALSREEVPPTYRTTVRNYFSALQSGEKPPDRQPAP